jgi:glucose/arabinose dehydrogenase
MKIFYTLLLSYFSLYSYSQSIGLTPFATGFTGPVEITHPTNDDRLFVVQQGGAIRILNTNGTINATNFLTLTTATISTGGERGLLGLTFHPNYATNGFFYVNYTNTAGNTVIARYTVSANPNVADATSGTILLTVTQPFANHNGGSIKFGPDGYLYIGMGDGGSAGDPGNRAQNINENLGKMLRLDVDSASPYGIPPTNPYAGIAGNDEIWAIGLRNPWKYSFDRLNGDLWIADVGQNQIEEIDHVANPAPGLNFGWNCYEANTVFSTCTSLATYTFPVAQYTHSAGACSITGGYVYTGSNYPNFLGKYFFADYCNNKIGLLDTTTNAYTWTTAFAGNNFSTFGEDRNGELYIAGVTSGVIYKITDISLNVSAFTNGAVSLYPNPASSEVHLKTNGMSFPAKVTITDISGKVLLNQEVNTEMNTIPTASLQSGLYLVLVKDNLGATFSSKLSVK